MCPSDLRDKFTVYVKFRLTRVECFYTVAYYSSRNIIHLAKKQKTKKKTLR